MRKAFTSSHRPRSHTTARSRTASAGLLLAVALVAAACGGTDPDDQSSESSTEGETAESSTLRIGLGSDLNSLDPANYSLVGDILRINLMYDGLTEIDSNFEIQPKLATEWEQIDDLTWQFTLRDDVTFHDGTHMDAEAVKFSLERAAASERGATLIGMIEEVAVLGDYQVELRLSRPSSVLVQNLAAGVADIVSPAGVEAAGGNFGQAPVGSGPYQFVEWSPNNPLILERFDDYWGEGFPTDRIEISAIPEATTRYSSLASGELDAIENPPTEIRDQLAADGDLVEILEPRARVVWVGFNVGTDSVADVELRRAIAQAIDKNSIVDDVLEGLGTAQTNGLIGLPYPEPDPTITIEQDVDAASATIAGLGANSLTMTVPDGRYLKDREVATTIQAQLAAVGLDLQLDVMETGSWWDSITTGQSEMFLLGWGMSNADPSDRLVEPFISDGAGMHGYTNPDYDALAEQLDVLAIGSGERDEVISEMQRLLVEEDVVVVPIYAMQNFWTTSTAVEGFATTPLEMIDLSETVVSGS